MTPTRPSCLATCQLRIAALLARSTTTPSPGGHVAAEEGVCDTSRRPAVCCARDDCHDSRMDACGLCRDRSDRGIAPLEGRRRESLRGRRRRSLPPCRVRLRARPGRASGQDQGRTALPEGLRGRIRLGLRHARAYVRQGRGPAPGQVHTCLNRLSARRGCSDACSCTAVYHWYRLTVQCCSNAPTASTPLSANAF